MPEITIPVDEAQLPTACDRLSREVERLEAAHARNVQIAYPARFARELGIAETDTRAMYSGHAATANNDVPYTIVIRHD